MAYEHELNIILPFGADLFRKISVAAAGPEWEQRFNTILKQAATVTTLCKDSCADRDFLFHQAATQVMGLAVLRADQLDANCLQIALYNKIKTGSISGTAADIQCWEALGLDSIIVQTPSPRNSVANTKNSVPDSPTVGPRQFRTFIMAKIHGYNQLPDSRLPDFITRWSELLEDSMQPYSKHWDWVETRGDSFLIAVDNVETAGEIALSLSKVFSNSHFVNQPGTASMGLKLFVHAGLVFSGTDGRSHQQQLFGENLLKTSKMFLNTPLNSIYVSEDFAAQLVMTGTKEFQYCYAGEQILPDNLGKFRLFRCNYSANGLFSRLLRYKNAGSVFEQLKAGPKGGTHGCVE